jgi:SAM-dependent methyltransferase
MEIVRPAPRSAPWPAVQQVVMQHDPVADVPSPIDLRRPSDAAEWAKTAMEKRPWRSDFFDRFAELVSGVSSAEILELGSGPGYLAERVIRAAPSVKYTLLDFSEAMHDLSKARLRGLSAAVQHITASFRDPTWSVGLGSFDFVLTIQAVHELRHKAHAPVLHAQVREILKPSGAYLVCDHYLGEDGMRNNQLYMTIAEQREALESAGFRVREIMRHRGLVLHHAA